MDLKIPTYFWFKPLRNLYLRCRTEGFIPHWAIRVWISSSRPPGAYATLSSTAMQSGEDPAAPRVATDPRPKRGRCDGDCPVPGRGQQHATVAAWVRRALPGTYRRLSPGGLGKWLHFAKSKSTPAQTQAPKDQMSRRGLLA